MKIALCTAIVFLCSLTALASLENPRLVEIADKDITPPGSIKAARPDAVTINGSLCVAYLQIAPRRIFRLLTLDENLNRLAEADMYSGEHNPTDVRLAQDENAFLWYAFETSNFSGPWQNFLNLAQYRMAGGPPVLINYKPDVARGNTVNPHSMPQRGDELTDDPAPFSYQGKYYVFTRQFEAPVMPVRVYSGNLEDLGTFYLDLGGAFGNMSVSVNSLVDTEDATLFIAGISNGPPGLPQSFSDIVALPLRQDLGAAAGGRILLSGGKEYETYVAGARYLKGKLYVAYDVIVDPRAGVHKGMLKVFDKDDHYKLLASVQVNEGRQVDNHITLELMGDKVFVFYNTPQERIRVKIMEWRRE